MKNPFTKKIVRIVIEEAESIIRKYPQYYLTELNNKQYLCYRDKNKKEQISALII